jgi:cell division protein FtsI/penicillin-binding protein 2
LKQAHGRRRLSRTTENPERGINGADLYRQTKINRDRHIRDKRQGGKVPLLILVAVLLIFAALLINQLYQIQIVEYEVNAQKAARQHFTKVTQQPERGRIYDANGVELAGTTYVYRIGITPGDVRSITKNITKQEIGEAIALALHLETDAVMAELAKTDATYIQLKKDVPKQEADTLKQYLSDNTIGGVRIDSEPRRDYTNGSLASQVIGFASFDNGNLTVNWALSFDTTIF